MSITALGAAGGLDVLAATLTTLRKAREINTKDSYIAYTQPARVEPITMVDSDVLYSDILPDVMQSLLSQFAGYYLQAFTLSCNVGKVNVVQQLDRLSPTRDPVYAAANMIGFEGFDYSHALPSFGRNFDSYQFGNTKLTVGYEHHQASRSGFGLESDNVVIDVYDKADKTPNGTVKDGIKEIKEAANLSVGKLLNVEIQDAGQKATIPVAVRLMTSIVQQDNLVHILAVGRKDTTMKERWHGWRSGRLEFVRDLILCQDLIDEHKNALMKDDSGVFDAILQRRAKNSISTLISSDVGIGSASNIAVVSTDTITKLESKLLGKISNYKVREKVFDETWLMILAVVDKQADRVTFYYRGIPESLNAGLRELKSSNKEGGTDVMSILNAFREGKSVAL